MGSTSSLSFNQVDRLESYPTTNRKQCKHDRSKSSRSGANADLFVDPA